VEFCVLRSGSSGNCTYFEHESTSFLLDAGGMSCKRLHAILEEIGRTPEDLDAIIGTHIHSDHINRSTFSICRKYGIPLLLHNDNISALHFSSHFKYLNDVTIQGFSNEAVSFGSIFIEPFEVPHDAAGVTSGFRFTPVQDSFSVVTYAADLGMFSDSLLPYFENAQHIILEANHDLGLLWANPYRTYPHKIRVSGDQGHLSNQQSADALLRILQKSDYAPAITLCHLSGDHNSPTLAIDTIGAFLENEGFSIGLDVATRKERTSFIAVEPKEKPEEPLVI